jgi:solute carrier family 25 protein 45/47
LLFQKSFITLFQLSGYFKGMSYPILSAGAMNSLFFGVYGVTLRAIAKNEEKPSHQNIFLAGCAGGAAQLAISCPVDLVKIKLQMQAGEGTWL